MTLPNIQSSPESQWSAFKNSGNHKNLSKLYFPDPITAKERNIHHVPVDRLLDYSWLDKVAHHVKTITYILPKTVFKGLRGDQDFTKTDQELIKNIPYYLSGLALMGCFVASGRKGVSAVRMGVGVGLYYAGALAANLFVDGLYKARYGVDFGLRYQQADGRVEKVFSSVDSPRFDLLTSQQYQVIRKKMGIPPDLADPNQACREQVVRAISSAESLKIMLGIILAAVGAGQIARTNAWAVALNPNDALRKIWSDPKTGGFFNRLRLTLKRGNEFLEFIFRQPLLWKKSTPIMRKSALWGLLGFLAYGLYQSVNVVKPKAYEPSPFQVSHSPSREAQRLRSQKAFQAFIEQRQPSASLKNERFRVATREKGGELGG